MNRYLTILAVVLGVLLIIFRLANLAPAADFYLAGGGLVVLGVGVLTGY
jgi:hypothetical protein